MDDRFPYCVYATQQDNSSIGVPSASEYGAIPWSQCFPVGTGESGDIAVHPEDDDIVYIGAIGSSPGGMGVLQRYNHHTKEIRLVSVWPEEYFGRAPKDLKYRFNWTYPIAFSPHDASVLYVAGNRVFRTTDEGRSWTAISPDLTRDDVTRQEASGGPITTDVSGAETYCTVYAFAESPVEKGVLWAGSDDGLIHVSKDGGGNWQAVTPAGLPEWTQVACIEPSSHDGGTAYVAATRYKLDDLQRLPLQNDGLRGVVDDDERQFSRGGNLAGRPGRQRATRAAVRWHGKRASFSPQTVASAGVDWRRTCRWYPYTTSR